MGCEVKHDVLRLGPAAIHRRNVVAVIVWIIHTSTVLSDRV